MFYRTGKDGLTLFIRLTPKAAKDTITGVAQAADGKVHLNVRVRAVPEDGKANRALIRFLAREMKVSPGAFKLVTGATARFKQVHVTGNCIALARLWDEKLKFLPD